MENLMKYLPPTLINQMAMNNTSSPPETMEIWTSVVSWNVKNGKMVHIASTQNLEDPPAHGFNARLPKAKTLRSAGHCYCLTRTKWINRRFLATDLQVCSRLGWPILNWNCLANCCEIGVPLLIFLSIWGVKIKSDENFVKVFRIFHLHRACDVFFSVAMAWSQLLQAIPCDLLYGGWILPSY